MITENDVVRAAAAALADHRWNVTQSLTTTQTGIDIVADRDGRCLLVEAKGYTSASVTSKRYGKPFDANQLWDHTSKAIYKAPKVAAVGVDIPAIALPTTRRPSNSSQTCRPLSTRWACW